MIGITEPRRVAAVSMAQRVGYAIYSRPPSIRWISDMNRLELNSDLPGLVAHQVRYDHSLTKHTRVKFMTDGTQQALSIQYQVFILSQVFCSERFSRISSSPNTLPSLWTKHTRDRWILTFSWDFFQELFLYDVSCLWRVRPFLCKWGTEYFNLIATQSTSLWSLRWSWLLCLQLWGCQTLRITGECSLYLLKFSRSRVDRYRPPHHWVWITRNHC